MPVKAIEQSLPKEIRIRQLESPAENGFIFYIKGHSDQDLLIEQFAYFPSAGMHDDGPDAAQMGYDRLRNMQAGRSSSYESVSRRAAIEDLI